MLEVSFEIKSAVVGEAWQGARKGGVYAQTPCMPCLFR